MVGKVRYSNTAPRFPLVLTINLSVYGGLRGVFLAQRPRACAHARAHARTRLARSPTGGRCEPNGYRLDYHKG